MPLLSQKEKEDWLKKNEKLILFWVWKFQKYNCFTLEELKQECYLQAWAALSKFDVEKAKISGNKISTYVSTHIRGYLQSYHAKYGTATKTTWQKLQTVKDSNISFEDYLDYGQNDLQSTFREEEIQALPLDFLSQLKSILTPLEYEIIIDSYDLDPGYRFRYNSFIGISKPSLLPIILTKLRTKLPNWKV